MLDEGMKNQVKSVFADLVSFYTLDVHVSPLYETRNELMELLGEVASCSDKITVDVHDGDGMRFSILKDGKDTGISFRGIPGGHEFTSLLLAILNSDGKGKNLPDESICKQIAALKGPIHLSTFVSLTCTNCPDVVQALNVMAICNPDITHEMVDGALNEEEASRMKVQAVPSVFADGKLLHVGRGDVGMLLSELKARYGMQSDKLELVENKRYDMIIVGGGPAGSAAAVYGARKGLQVAMIAERIGGQVKETVDIENLISVPLTTGQQLAMNLEEHMREYPIDIYEHRHVEKVEILEDGKKLTTTTGESFIAPAVIVATGASWRRLGIPGEADYIGRGVAFCTHCDGPLFAGKKVAVIGGGNSGIEAAIDLAAICTHVTVVEFMNELKADDVLQNKLRSLPNVDVMLHTQSIDIFGNGDKVAGLRVKDREKGAEKSLDVEGVFIQIGLSPNSDVFKDIVETRRPGEIVIDEFCRTSAKGIYAAGDVTTVPYKQIVIAMGEGAKAALSAFDDRIRGVI